MWATHCFSTKKKITSQSATQSLTDLGVPWGRDWMGNSQIITACKDVLLNNWKTWCGDPTGPAYAKVWQDHAMNIFVGCNRHPLRSFPTSRGWDYFHPWEMRTNKDLTHIFCPKRDKLKPIRCMFYTWRSVEKYCCWKRWLRSRQMPKNNFSTIRTSWQSWRMWSSNWTGTKHMIYQDWLQF